MPTEPNLDFDHCLTAALFAAALEGDRPAVHDLLQENVDINYVGIEKMTVLILSAANGDQAAVDTLIERDGLEINAQANGGLSALMLSSYKNRPDSVTSLMKHKLLKINDADANGFTALMHAAVQGHTQVVAKFKDCSAEVVNATNHIKEAKGTTALILAVIANRAEVVECLTQFPKIKVNAADDLGTTALLHAATRGHHEIVVHLKDHAKLDTADNKGFTALMSAAEMGHGSIVKTLLDAGADRTPFAQDGRTAQDMARDKGHDYIVELLDDSAKNGQAVPTDAPVQSNDPQQELDADYAEGPLVTNLDRLELTCSAQENVPATQVNVELIPSTAAFE